MSKRSFKRALGRKRKAPVVVLALVVTLGLAVVGCGGSGSASAPPVSKKAACQRTFEPALRAMRSLIAGDAAGMTVGTFNEEYPKVAGPVQLADDAAATSVCPSVIGYGFDDLYSTLKTRAGSDHGIARWNAAYEDLQSQIAALR
jgi:hypothetical protein